jgi:hypothetical protein
VAHRFLDKAVLARFQRLEDEFLVIPTCDDIYDIYVLALEDFLIVCYHLGYAEPFRLVLGQVPVQIADYY